MALAASQIVAAIAARIPGAAVYTDHPQPFAEDDLPAWRVHRVPGGEVAPQTLARDTLQRHELRVECLGYARATAGLDAALDTLAAPALAAIFAAAPQVPPDALDGMAGLIELSLAGEVEIDMQGEGEAAVGVVTVPLRAIYFTRASAPETITLN